MATRILKTYDPVITSSRIASLLKNIKGGLLALQAFSAIVFVLQWISPWKFWLLRATNGIFLAMFLASLVLVRGIRRGIREVRDVLARHAEHQRFTSIDEQYWRHWRAFLDNQDPPYLALPTFYFDKAYPSTVYFPGVNGQSVPPTYVREARNIGHTRHAEHQHLTNIDEQYGRRWWDLLPYLVPPTTFNFDDVYPSSLYFQDVYGRLVPPNFVRAIMQQVLDDIKEGIVVVWMIFSKVLEFKIMGACLLCLLTFAVNGGDGVQLAAVLNRPVMKWMLRFYVGRVVAVVLVLTCWIKKKKRSRASSRPFELSPKVYVFCTGSSSSSFGNVDSAGGSNSTLSVIVDSGASYHATGCREIFLDDFQDEALDETGNTIRAANGYAMSIRGRGSISLPGITLPRVLYVPELRVNVVSASQLTLMDYYVRFDRNGCLVREVCTEAVVGRGRLTYDMLYQMETLAVPLDRGRCKFCELIGGQLFLT